MYDLFRTVSGYYPQSMASSVVVPLTSLRVGAMLRIASTRMDQVLGMRMCLWLWPSVDSCEDDVKVEKGYWL